jgi:hypothetical protein
MFAPRKDERKLQCSRGNILGFINTGYFKSDNVPDGFKIQGISRVIMCPMDVKMQRTIHFRISEKSWLQK